MFCSTFSLVNRFRRRRDGVGEKVARFLVPDAVKGIEDAAASHAVDGDRIVGDIASGSHTGAGCEVHDTRHQGRELLIVPAVQREHVGFFARNFSRDFVGGQLGNDRVRRNVDRGDRLAWLQDDFDGVGRGRREIKVILLVGAESFHAHLDRVVAHIETHLRKFAGGVALERRGDACAYIRDDDRRARNDRSALVGDRARDGSGFVQLTVARHAREDEPNDEKERHQCSRKQSSLERGVSVLAKHACNLLDVLRPHSAGSRLWM